MKKIFVILFIILFCFGCRANYNLVINEDLSIDESVVGLEDENFYSVYSSSKSNVIKNVLYPINEFLISKGYNFNEVEQDSMYGASISNSYLDLDDFKNNSKVYLQFYNSFNFNNEKGIVTLSLNDKVIWDGVSLERFIVDDGKVSITLPFKVIEHNADSHNDNTYTWNVNSTNDKNILIKFDINSKNEKSAFTVVFITVVIIIASFSLLAYIYFKKSNTRNII